MEERRHWREGQKVSWPKVEPYTIVRLVGDAGNIQISEIGKYHVYWHRENDQGDSYLIHHGGRTGFGSLEAVMHQHERVILGYTGLTIQLPPEQVNELPEEEHQTGIPVFGQTFPDIIGEMQALDLPGEQQTLGNWIKTLQDTNRDLPAVNSHGQLTRIREDLDSLRRNLGRSINSYKKRAGTSLERGLSGSRGQLLFGVNEAQALLLQRAQQTVSIVVGTMKRYNNLEKLMIDWNNTVGRLPGMAGQLMRTLQSRDLYGDRLQRAVDAHILNGRSSIEAQLNQLQGEPYYSRAQEFAESFSPLRNLWEERNYAGMMRVLNREARELEIWRRRIRERYYGVNFGKYNLT